MAASAGDITVRVLPEWQPLVWAVTTAMAGTGVKEDAARLHDLLATGWEPFAVTAGSCGYTYHLRFPAPAPAGELETR